MHTRTEKNDLFTTTTTRSIIQFTPVHYFLYGTRTWPPNTKDKDNTDVDDSVLKIFYDAFTDSKAPSTVGLYRVSTTRNAILLFLQASTDRPHIHQMQTGIEESLDKRDLLYLGSEFWKKNRGTVEASSATNEAWIMVGMRTDVWNWLNKMETYITDRMSSSALEARCGKKESGDDEGFWSMDHMIPKKLMGPDHLANYFLLPKV